MNLSWLAFIPFVMYPCRFTCGTKTLNSLPLFVWHHLWMFFVCLLIKAHLISDNNTVDKEGCPHQVNLSNGLSSIKLLFCAKSSFFAVFAVFHFLFELKLFVWTKLKWKSMLTWCQIWSGNFGYFQILVKK